MLKEILKIDGSDTADHKNDMKQFGNEASVPCNRRDEYLPSQPKQNKKLGE
jgi:5'-3' exoribonuclease 1